MHIIFNPVKWSLSLILACLLFSNTANSQSKTTTINGIIKEYQSDIPVVNANIKIAETTISTVSNAKGEFGITYVLDKYSKKLQITCIGYIAQIVDLSIIESGQLVEVRLKRNTAELKEVKINNETASGIVAHAYRNIPLNYPIEDTYYTGFYRESSYAINNNTEEPLYLLESVIGMKKASYLKPAKEESIGLLETRKYLFPTEIKNPMRWEAGTYTPSRFDVVKKRFDFINPAYQKKYTYKIISHLDYHHEDTFIISFEPLKNARYRGKIYINSSSYAIVKVDYQLTPEGLKTENLLLLTQTTFNHRKYAVTYQHNSSKVWHLDNIRQEANVTFQARNYKYVTEFATLKFDYVKLNDFTYNEGIQFHESLLTKETPSHSIFWTNFNISKSTQSIDELLIDTSRKVLSKDSLSFKKTSSDSSLQLLSNDKAYAQKTNKNRKKIHLTVSYILPELTLINSSVQSLDFQYISSEGQLISNRHFNLSHNKVAISYGFKLAYEISRVFAVGIKESHGFGKFTSNGITLSSTYQFLLSDPNKRPIHLITGISYAFNSINRAIDTYRKTSTPVNIDGHSFQNDIAVSLLSHQQGIRPLLGLSIEKRPHLDYFMELSYSFTTSQTDDIRFTDQPHNFFKSLFPKSKEIPIQSSGSHLLSDNLPSSKLPFQGNFSLGVGVKF